MLDMKQLWNYLDNEIQVTPMPKEYEDFFVDILCKDCHEVSSTLWNSSWNQNLIDFVKFKESSVKFHVVGLKCQNSSCGGYNTTRTQKRTNSNKVTPSSLPEGGNDTDDAASSSTNNRDNVA